MISLSTCLGLSSHKEDKVERKIREALAAVMKRSASRSQERLLFAVKRKAVIRSEVGPNT